MGIFELSEVEKKLGYVFKDKNLLRTCFVHSSFSNENKSSESNERLEFLGDSVLGMVVAEYLFLRDKEFREGVLTSEKQKYVSSVPLSETTRKIGLNKFLLLGVGNESDRDKNSICEDLYEATVGGLYLDGGMEVAKKFIYSTLLTDRVKEKTIDYKSELQMFTQGKKMGVPVYKVLSQTGPSNNPTFKIAVFVQDKQICSGTGNKKSVAEQLCAKKALELYKNNSNKQNCPKGTNKNEKISKKSNKNKVNNSKNGLAKNNANLVKKKIQKNHGAN